MNWQKIKAIAGLGVFALFIIGAGVGAWLVQQNQDTRQQASGGCEFMDATSQVAGLFTKIDSSRVAFCDADGGEYNILVKYNNKPVDQEKISEETKTFSPGEVYIYNNQCPPPDASYTGDLAININTAGQEPARGWGHVYTCPASSIQPDPDVIVVATPQVPESIDVTRTPVDQPTNTPTLPATSSSIVTATPGQILTPTNTVLPSAKPTAIPTSTVESIPTSTPEPTLAYSDQPVPTRPVTSDFPSEISPTASPTNLAQCNEACDFNSDCANIRHVCADTSVGKRCRLATDPDSLLCVPLDESQITPSVTATPDVTITPLPVCRADLNRDGIVDLSDYLFIRDRFLLRDTEQALYIDEADIDKDGIVDLVDYSILVQEFFMHCQN